MKWIHMSINIKKCVLNMKLIYRTSIMEGLKWQLIAQSNIRFMSVGDLIVGHAYPITKMVNQETQYGRTVKCTIDDGYGEIIEVFLPRTIVVSDEEEALYNVDGNQTLSLVFNGRRGRSFNITFKWYIYNIMYLNFIIIIFTLLYYISLQ